MKQDSFISRTWVNVTGLLLPLLLMAAYVLGWSPLVRAALAIVCFGGILGPWIVASYPRFRHGRKRGQRLRVERERG